MRETDLGEYIIQEAGETPSHIIAPAIHRTKDEISDLFHDKHKLPRKTDIGEMTREARMIMRPHFLTADMGISGANFLVAETGTTHDRHQRGQRSHDHHAAARARRDRRHREGAAHAGGRVVHPAAADALGHRTVDKQLPHFHYRAEAARRSGRPRGIPRHHRGRRAHQGHSTRTCARRCAASAAAPA